jgi:predicted transcriptional regulator
VTFKISYDLLNKADALAAELRENRCSLIKKSLSFYIDNYDGIIAKMRLEDPETETIPHEEVLKEYGLL